jgi:hypothetical protein
MVDWIGVDLHAYLFYLFTRKIITPVSVLLPCPDLTWLRRWRKVLVIRIGLWPWNSC